MFRLNLPRNATLAVDWQVCVCVCVCVIYDNEESLIRMTVGTIYKSRADWKVQLKSCRLHGYKSDELTYDWRTNSRSVVDYYSASKLLFWNTDNVEL